MELEAARQIGAGIAVISMMGVGVGIGLIFSSMINSIARNPASQQRIFPVGMLGFALTEAIALFALLIALVILFV